MDNNREERTSGDSPTRAADSLQSVGAPARADAPNAATSETPSPAQTAAVFGRPDGVTGSFDRSRSEVADARPQPELRAPDPVLAEAFGRPQGETETLQRDPFASYGADDPEPAPFDPWRDPESPARLDGPALTEPGRDEPTDPGPKLGLREVLFGRRVHWYALATLGVIALLVGLVGGLMGRWTAEVVAPLNSQSVKLVEGESRGDDARSHIVDVARAVEKSVVAIEVFAPGTFGNGSGFVLDDQGYILTNNHVISLAANDRNARVEVVFNDRQRVKARIAGRDIRTDLAVLKVDDVAGITKAALGKSSELQIGETVVAFGSPLGLDRTVTTGIVSAVNRPVPLAPDASSDTDAVIDAIQTDAAINPGNSGGPLVNDRGEVVGVNTAALSTGGGSIGLGFAIPIDEAKPLALRLIADGEVKHAQIGVTASSVRNDRVLGAQIRSIVAGGPADRAGVRENDVITSFDGRPIEGADELTVAARKAKIDEEVSFTYWRDGRTFDGTIVPRSE